MLLEVTGWFVYQVLRFPAGSRWGEAIHFFFYDSLKIIILLYLMIFVIGVFRSYLSPRRIQQWLSRAGSGANVLAALFGAVTPFCSCSSIPIFYGFLEAGIPLGVAFSFLITSPMINEYLVVLMLGFFGWRITLFYVASGLLIGVIGGAILGRLGLEKELESDLFAKRRSGQEVEKTWNSFADRLRYGLDEANSITKSVWLWLLLGVALGALIHNFVPREALEAIVSRTGPLSVPLAVLLGVPMYASCAAIVPIAVVLFQKGVPLGTAVAFMMATAALSLPEAIMLRRAMKLKLILIFFGLTALAIVLTGYGLNFFQSVFGVN